ncbi:MAG: BadF/BadG/BcrA/BcrD ATPase family protein, partial [Gemmatimonadales bacterium]
AAGVARQVRVLGDAEVGLFAAFEGGPGVLLIAGTGSIAFARDPQGTLQRRGGYGWQLGDEGGGYWLGRRALAAAGRTHDGREEGTTLLARLLGALGLRDFDDLVRWAATATTAQVAGLAPQVLNAARDGEGVALRLLEEAAQELADLVGSLGRHFPEPDPLRVATAGGLLRVDSPLYRAVLPALRTTVPRARLEGGAVDAALGALRLARELVGG